MAERRLGKLFSPPYKFFGGAGSSTIVPREFGVSIGGHAYAVDLRQYARETIDAFRDAIDNQALPGDASLETEGMWRLSVTHWEHGAGQVHLDDKDSDPFRFRNSKGVDVFSLPHGGGEMRLLPGTELKTGTDGGGSEKIMRVGNMGAYLILGSDVKHGTDFTDTAPTLTTVTGLTGTPVSLTNDGSNVYIATTSAVYRQAAFATPATSFSANAFDFILYANGHLFASDENVLSEIDSGGTPAVIYTHVNSSFDFVCGTGSPTGVFVGGNGSDRGEFFFVGFNSQTGGLATPLPAGSLPRGEFIRCMEFYGGFLLLGTSKGFRLAEIVGDRGVSPGPVIDAFGNVTGLDVDADFCWVTWSDFDISSSGIARLWLRRFTEPLVPAYASDLMAENDTGNVNGVVSLDDKRYFLIDNSGLYGEREDGALVESGFLDSGLLRFDTMERKIASQMDLRHYPLSGSIGLQILLEDGTVYDVGTSDTANSVRPSNEFSAGNVRGEALEVRVTLNRDASDDTAGPVLCRWTLRALIVPLRSDYIIVPLILKSKVDNLVGEGQSVPFDPLTEFLFLKGLESSRSPVVYQEGDLSELVVVDKVMVKPEKWWKPKHRWFEGFVPVRLLTVRPTTGS